MPTRSFDSMLAELLKDPEFAEEFAAERCRLDEDVARSHACEENRLLEE